jgi:hypothetical protein
MPIDRAYPVFAGYHATTRDARLPGECSVSLPCSHIIVDEHSGANVLRLPLWLAPKKDDVADERIELPEFGPAMVVVLNRTGAPLTVKQPARRAQPSHYDLKGCLHSYEPPTPGPTVGILSGSKWTAFAEFAFVGVYSREWQLIRASEGWEPTPETSDE